VEKFRYPENVVFREEPEGGILFDVNTGKLKLVEDVAWGICNLIDKGKTRTAILRELEKLYPEETTLENDLDLFLNELIETEFLISLEED
jgi:hypothetical protein